MKFKRQSNYPDVELPEKVNATYYINVRSAVRVDVRPNETLRVPTGVSASVARTEKAALIGTVSGVIDAALTSGDLYITITNEGDRNFMIYPGMVLAEIEVEKTEKTKAAKKPVKRATFISDAQLSNNYPE